EGRLSRGGPAREARIPTYPTGPVPTRHRRDRHVPREIRRGGEHGHRPEGSDGGPERSARGDPSGGVPRSPRVGEAGGYGPQRDPGPIQGGRAPPEGTPPVLRRCRSFRRPDGAGPETGRGRPPGLPGTEPGRGGEGDRVLLRGTEAGGAGTGHGIDRARGIHLDSRRAERRRPVGALPDPPRCDPGDEGGRVPPGARPRGRCPREGGAAPRGRRGPPDLLPAYVAPAPRRRELRLEGLVEPGGCLDGLPGLRGRVQGGRGRP